MSTSHKQLLDVINEFFDNGGSREDCLEKMQNSNMDAETLKKVITVARLYKSKYFSYSNRVRRTFKTFFVSEKNRAEVIFQLLSNYLMISSHYNTSADLTKKIEEAENTIKNLEESTGYQDPLYWGSGECKRKVYILMNAHFSDFDADKPLQDHVVNLMGKEEIEQSVNGRANFVHRMVKSEIN